MFVDTSGMSGGRGGGRRGPKKRKPPKLAKKSNKQNNTVGKLGSEYNRLSSQFPDRTLTEETVDVNDYT